MPFSAQLSLSLGLTLVAIVGDKDNPREEQAPGNGCKGRIDGCMRRIIHIVDVTHGRWSQHRSKHTHCGRQPAQTQLQRAQLRILILAQGIAQQNAHDVHSGAVRWERVHVVGSAEEALYAVEQERIRIKGIWSSSRSNSLGAKVNVVGQLIYYGRIITRCCAHCAEQQQGEETATWPAPEGQDEDRCDSKQLRIDAQMMRVRQTHLTEPKVVVYEEQIAPPVLLADVRMVTHHQVPLWSRAPQGQHVCAEEYQRSQGRHNAAGERERESTVGVTA